MKRLLAVLMILVLTLHGCGYAETKEVNHAPSQEQRLVIYTSHKEEVYRPIIREFEERTGIWVEIVTGGTNELLKQIEMEQNAPKGDIMFGGGVESLESSKKLFTRVTSVNSENIIESLLDPDEIWYPFSALPIVLVYNTKLVNPEELTGWNDLLNPRYFGRIAFADPYKSGSSFTELVTAVNACGNAWMSDFSSTLNDKVLESSGEVLSYVADGTALIGITLEETAQQHIRAGENIGMIYPVEGTSCVPDGTAIIHGAPHYENAIRFLSFTMSYEVQQMIGNQFCRRPIRTDVAANESLTNIEKIQLIDYPIQWAAKNREEILSNWDICRRNNGV